VRAHPRCSRLDAQKFLGASAFVLALVFRADKETETAAAESVSASGVAVTTIYAPGEAAGGKTRSRGQKHNQDEDHHCQSLG
jgi:hypothetical protein